MSETELQIDIAPALFADTFFEKNRSAICCFDVMRAIEEFRDDFPGEFTAEEAIVEFNEPMTPHAVGVYVDLTDARGDPSYLQQYVDHLMVFVEEGY